MFDLLVAFGFHMVWACRCLHLPLPSTLIRKGNETTSQRHLTTLTIVSRHTACTFPSFVLTRNNKITIPLSIHATGRGNSVFAAKYNCDIGKFKTKLKHIFFCCKSKSNGLAIYVSKYIFGVITTLLRKLKITHLWNVQQRLRTSKRPFQNIRRPR